jgi:hypothetical protein
LTGCRSLLFLIGSAGQRIGLTGCRSLLFLIGSAGHDLCAVFFFIRPVKGAGILEYL